MKYEEIKKMVRDGYAKIAKKNDSCCAPVESCCGTIDVATDISKKIGYHEEELGSIPFRERPHPE